MRLLLVLLLICLVSPANAREPLRIIEGIVTRVTDGDTIQVTDHLGTRIKVRLYGIDAPETAKGNLPGQPHGEASHRALTEKTLSRQVRLDVLDIDKYRRLVSLVRIGTRTINREMVAEGHAWAFRKYLDKEYAADYLSLEAAAAGQGRAGASGSSTPRSRHGNSGKPARRNRGTDPPSGVTTMLIYLASPLGFSPELGSYRQRIKDRLTAQGHQILDPWEQQQVEHRISAALLIDDLNRQMPAIGQAAAFAGQANADAITRADGLLAVLDGAEPDSGTAAELGYAAGLGKVCFGLRTDLRDMGDLPWLAINLQVQHFISASGGTLFRSIEALRID